MSLTEQFRRITASELHDKIQLKQLDPNAIDDEGTLPLICAMHLHRADLLETLLSDGADPNLKTPDGDYPLQVACRWALHNEIGYRYLDALLTRGADLNRQFVPPLHGASFAGDLRLVLFLLNHGADADFYDDDDHLPAEWVTRSDAPQAMKDAILSALARPRSGSSATD